MKKYNQHKPNPLEHLTDDEIHQFLNAGTYSANLRWEAIRRKMINGEYDPIQSGKDSLYMLNRLAFFSELNQKETFSQEAKELISKTEPSNQLAGKENELETSIELQSLPVSRNLVQDDKKIDVGTSEPIKSETKALRSPIEKPEGVRLPHNNFTASPFLRWIKAIEPSESKVQTIIPTKEVEDLTYDLNQDAESKKSKKDKKKFTKNKKLKKSKNKVKKSKLKDNDLSLNPEIISETLADLLANQGHIDEANEMYRQLGIKYPEKSSYFASKLKKS